MDTPTISRCVAFLEALTALTLDDWRHRVLAGVPAEDEAARRVLAPFVDLVPR